MAGYLDDNGLSEVWKKIKSRSIPVKVISQNNYNSLSASEKKKNILYIIDGEKPVAYFKDVSLSGGSSIPPGGLSGQFLMKKSDSDYDVEWHDAPKSDTSQVTVLDDPKSLADSVYVGYISDANFNGSFNIQGEDILLLDWNQ